MSFWYPNGTVVQNWNAHCHQLLMALLSEDRKRMLQVYVLASAEAQWWVSQSNLQAGVHVSDSQAVWLSL